MPTASTTSAKAPKARAKAARRSTAAKAARRGRAASASTQSKATRAKASRTSAAKQTDAGLKQAQTATRWTISDRPAQAVGDYAERAVLIPVGAALIARDRVVSTVTDTISTYSSTSKTQQQLRRFERRGATARNRLEREVRKARVRVERDLRQRRRVIESTVSEIEDRRDTIAKNGTELANRVQERILSLV